MSSSNKLREAAIELLKSAPDHIDGHWPELDEVVKALAKKQECETCANKRKKLTDAGLLKTPLRGIAEGPGYEPVVFTNVNSVSLLIGTNEVMRVTGDGITFSDRVDPIDTSSTCVDENEKREHEPVAWTQVSDGLPRSGITVLACYRNSLGKFRRIRAHWVAAKTMEASVDYGECYEYDEETDEYYLLEGWYECIDNWDEYSSVAVCEGEVTHWMPLPPEPDEQSRSKNT